ncbi:uncharacterized protein V1510DRAFT_401222 [Dipodascopsis tothii]|uniref:uncharacterized protein n=1 Tax=Dipodascopsis tothii TaxID=44089 RepID=UPI0034CD8EA7
MLSSSTATRAVFVAMIVVTTVVVFALASETAGSLRSVVRPLSFGRKTGGRPAQPLALGAAAANAPGPECADPYVQDGFLHTTSNVRDTRWLPLYLDDRYAEPPANAQYPPARNGDAVVEPTFSTAPPPPAVLGRAPRNWLRDAANYHFMLQDVANHANRGAGTARTLSETDRRLTRDLHWLHNRRLLVLGDSVDRFMIQFICEEFGSTSREAKSEAGTDRIGGKHTSAYCHIPTLNFTVAHWHVAGMYTLHPDWWWLPHMDTVAFEERWPKFFEPFRDRVAGLDGRNPDLILFQSGLWDERMFRESAISKLDLPRAEAVETALGREGRPLTWDETTFFKARMAKFIDLIRDNFPAVPVMYRSLTTRREAGKADLPTIGMDRVSRHLAAQNGIKVFEWASLVRGHSTEYLDYLHMGRGSSSYLWGQMVLHYLFSAAGGVQVEGQVVRWPEPEPRQYVVEGQGALNVPSLDEIRAHTAAAVPDGAWQGCRAKN